MVTISFLTMKKKLVSGKKTQTIRLRKSEHWLKLSKGDTIHAYWKQQSPECKFLFKSELSEDPFVVKWGNFSEELAIQDGFKSLKEANEEWFIPRYGKDGEVVPEKEFVVLRWYSPV